MILNSLKTILKFTFHVEIKNTMQQHWKLQQLNKTKQKKILQMIISFIYSSEVQFMKMYLKSDHFYTISK